MSPAPQSEKALPQKSNEDTEDVGEVATAKGKFNSGGWDSFNRNLPWPHFLRLPGKLHLYVGDNARYHICSFLDCADLSNLKLVNKECHDLVKNRGG
jgi:hypothetical protein